MVLYAHHLVNVIQYTIKKSCTYTPESGPACLRVSSMPALHGHLDFDILLDILASDVSSLASFVGTHAHTDLYHLLRLLCHSNDPL